MKNVSHKKDELNHEVKSFLNTKYLVEFEFEFWPSNDAEKWSTFFSEIPPCHFPSH